MSDFSGPERLLELKKEYLVPCLYHFYKRPMQLVRGEMQYLFDSTGKRYTDLFAGVSVVNCGHCNPEITEAVVRQVRTLTHVCNIYLTEPVLRLAEELAKFSGDGLSKSFFVNSGSEATEGAVLLAALATGRSELLAVRRGLHGRTKLGMSLTGLGMWRTDPAPVGGIHFVPCPDCADCELSLKHPSCGLACAEAADTVIRTETSGKPAALIAEPILGNGGVIEPPEGYWPKVASILRNHGALLVADEVQTGFCRTGKRFAFENWGVVPDVRAAAKALGNGFPVGVFSARPDLAASYTRPGASTLGGNPVSMAAGLAVLDYMTRNRLEDRAADLGSFFKQGLEALSSRRGFLGKVRGRGLMLGLPVGEARGKAAPEIVDFILEEMKDRGFLLGKNGLNRNVLAFQPPLVIERRDLDAALSALDEVLGLIP